MGGLNAALVVLASQTSLGAGLSAVERQIEGGVIAIYALFAMAFLLQAITALRPANFRPWKAWQDISLQQLNAELAVQLHSVCLKNQARKLALRGLYGSLRNMAMVFLAILLLFAIFSVL